VLAKEWPKPLEDVLCGYAGGLGPDNIEAQLELISKAVGNREIWVDMETHVRSNDDQRFDLDKVEKVLEICAKSGYIWD
jgi:hypothetical protein